MAAPPTAPGPAPPFLDDVCPSTGAAWRFYRTEVERADQLTNGRAWIQAFEHVLQNMPRPRRQLVPSISDSGDPRHTLPSYGPKQRNDAARAMRDPAATPGLPEAARTGFGRQLRLPSGDEVLVIVNVGRKAPLQLPRKFRDMSLEELEPSIIVAAARCPHMGACLNEGEIKDVEDLAGGGRRAVVRCPWHNQQFDLHSGEGEGNASRLPLHHARVLHGALYVGAPLPPGARAEPARAPGAAVAEAMDVDEPSAAESGDALAGQRAASPGADQPLASAARRQKSRSPRPPGGRVLRQMNTIC
ncbi:unnamed protein product [Prorocentrum cordatum]|uniref:Rieske domain-containing protein n=1 Tax=Prorocentrum cordatum TaxID=2364126 RepID=A0ABN9WVB1_9DINO|nr:unnamed protein product [Polarella glacialis]